jgi:hypothetical protein
VPDVAREPAALCVLDELACGQKPAVGVLPA